MDDLTITAKSVPKGRWILEDLVELTDWARMEFKPAKSRSLVLRRGRVQNRFCLKIRADIISMVQEKPVKSLSKESFNDKQSLKEMLIQAETWITSLKMSAYPVSIRPGDTNRLLWPLLVDKVPISTVEGLERKMNTYLRRWLGVPRSFCSIGLYTTDS
ncbi:hypothetical protein N1851_002288 [Merluccius polli]|uniref:Reverse transcriptase n=1 Tax=Merluccius polli TaxID=89951 RepID=A0AA47NAC6_MERPO|nr:hypothetical protein N1851_002288 [Merluccius polli]